MLPIVGAFVDRSGHKKWNMAGFAFAGSFFASLLFFLQGDQWQLGAFAVVASSILGGCSLIAYYAILVDISTEEERDRASSRGWAFGYLGGGLLLRDQPRHVPRCTTPSGSARSMAVRLSLLSAALWWARSPSSRSCGCTDYAPVNVVVERGGAVAAQLRAAVHHAARDARATR